MGGGGGGVIDMEQKGCESIIHAHVKKNRELLALTVS